MGDAFSRGLGTGKFLGVVQVGEFGIQEAAAGYRKGKIKGNRCARE